MTAVSESPMVKAGNGMRMIGCSTVNGVGVS